jgi:hypothetical protein
LLVAGLSIIAFIFWVDAGRRLRSSQRAESDIDVDPGIDWDRLEARADSVIQWTIESLPEELRVPATEAGWAFRRWSREFSPRRIFGLGGGYQMGRTSIAAGPVILFLGDIITFVKLEGDWFDDEVRRAYLTGFGLKLRMSQEEIDALVDGVGEEGSDGVIE